MSQNISTWSGTWESGYPGVTGTMKIPLYSVIANNMDYSTYCETKYTGLYSYGKTIRVNIEVTAGDPYPKLQAKNGDQTITYTINEINENGEMTGTYKSVNPGDNGYWNMRREN